MLYHHHPTRVNTALAASDAGLDREPKSGARQSQFACEDSVKAKLAPHNVSCPILRTRGALDHRLKSVPQVLRDLQPQAPHLEFPPT